MKARNERENRKFCKSDLFLRASTCHNSYVQITGKAVNHGDLKGMKVPYVIKFVGKIHFINVLTKEFQKHE